VAIPVHWFYIARDRGTEEVALECFAELDGKGIGMFGHSVVDAQV
jgi:hypothetical protein